MPQQVSGRPSLSVQMQTPPDTVGCRIRGSIVFKGNFLPNPASTVIHRQVGCGGCADLQFCRDNNLLRERQFLPVDPGPHQLKRLFDALEDSFGFDGLAEFTVEAGRPDSITAEKLAMIRNYPVTRISVNPQTMNQETLDIIGRRHTVQETRQAFLLAREHGFDNINMDLIVGLPGEDISMVENTLREIRELAPDSMTVHSLAVKRAARLNIFKDQYQEMTFENNQQIMDLTMKTAYEMGMGPYYLYRQKNMKGNFENVGYAKVDKAGIYNILIMEEKQPIIAVGAGGSSKLVHDRGKRIERVENVKDVWNYITRIDEMIERKRAGIEAWL